MPQFNPTSSDKLAQTRKEREKTSATYLDFASNFLRDYQSGESEKYTGMVHGNEVAKFMRRMSGSVSPGENIWDQQRGRVAMQQVKEIAATTFTDRFVDRIMEIMGKQTDKSDSLIQKILADYIPAQAQLYAQTKYQQDPDKFAELENTDTFAKEKRRAVEYFKMRLKDTNKPLSSEEFSPNVLFPRSLGELAKRHGIKDAKGKNKDYFESIDNLANSVDEEEKRVGLRAQAYQKWYAHKDAADEYAGLRDEPDRKKWFSDMLGTLGTRNPNDPDVKAKLDEIDGIRANNTDPQRKRVVSFIK